MSHSQRLVVACLMALALGGGVSCGVDSAWQHMDAVAETSPDGPGNGGGGVGGGTSVTPTPTPEGTTPDGPGNGGGGVGGGTAPAG